MNEHEWPVYESWQRVPYVAPDLSTRFLKRAVRRARALNARRIFPSYRWETVLTDGRWQVVAFQNFARPPSRDLTLVPTTTREAQASRDGDGSGSTERAGQGASDIASGTGTGQ